MTRATQNAEEEDPALPTRRVDDGALLAACRHQAGLSQAELGARLEVPEHIVALWESPGYEGVDLSLMRRVAAATGRELEIRFTRSQQGLQIQQGLQTKVSRAIAAAGLLACLAIIPGCITETTSSLRTPSQGALKTEGVIIYGDIDEIWADIQRVVAGLTREPLLQNGVKKSFTTRVNGEDLWVLVEPRDAQRTVIHVNTANADIARYIRERVTLR